MRLKYYLKGLGIGMIITALLMGIATREPSTMTDDEIKIRAKELGMVEPKTLADARQEVEIEPTLGPDETKPPVISPSVEENQPADEKQPIEIPKETDEPNIETQEKDEKEPEVTIAPTAEPANTPEPLDSQELISFEIHRGESSDSISKRLEEQGIVEDAVSYNNYLCNNGYDTKLNIGTYQLAIGMTKEEITKIITKTR